jgi:filamentous hemagglutinin family protein
MQSSNSLKTTQPLAVLVPLVIVVGLSNGSAKAAQPLPAGGAFVAGTGVIATGAQSVTVSQTSSRGVIDWTSFDIGAGRTVNIGNGTGATLNRVTGGTPSSILGALNATGSVYLINPQGVLIGPGGVVTTGGRFVASALDVNNDSFMNGGPLTFANGGNGAVVNMGKIGSSGGDVFLIARSNVSNEGTISAAQGTVELAAGAQVLLQESLQNKQIFVAAGSAGTVSNAGAIDAAQVSLQAADGNVYALAGNHSAIRATGTTTRDGHVWLIADTGHVQIHDSIAATNADGGGGTVDSSGTTLNIGNSTVNAAQWNLTVPVSYTIDQTTASALSASLNQGTSIDMEVTRKLNSLALNGLIGWDSAASLTLGAERNVGIARTASISNTSAGDLILRADAGSIDGGGSVVNLGKIDWSQSTGKVSMLYDINGAYTPGTLLSNTQWQAAPYSGDVTQVTAYRLVNNAADLGTITANLAGNYALGTDFVAGSVAPIGTGTGSSATPFTGQFDGFGHTISNLLSNYGQGNDAGMFLLIGKSGAVRNLNLASATASGNEGMTGILAATNQGTVAYVSATGSSTTCCYTGTTGGLVGLNEGLIERSSSGASGGGGEAGGLVGVNMGTIEQSFATGDVYAGSHGTTGGLVGVNMGTITQSYATGSPAGLYGGGGIANANDSGGVIDESFATGALSGEFAGSTGAGGIVSANAGTINSNVYWNAQTTMRTNAAGYNAGGTVPPDTNGLTTAQMSVPSSFAGWDFGPNGVWAMPQGAQHPVLQWQLEQQH